MRLIALSVGLKLFQEAKASSATAKLKAMISVNATVLRDGATLEVAVAHLVPGDLVHLAAGDMIPGDVRIVQAKDLFVTQGSLTGERLSGRENAPRTRGRHPRRRSNGQASPSWGPASLKITAHRGGRVD